MLPTVVNQDKRLRQVAVAFGEGETDAVCSFVLKSVRELCPEWLEAHPTPVLCMDAKLGQETVTSAIPGARVHICLWHWLCLDFPYKFRRLSDYSSALEAVKHLKHQQTPDDYNAAWEEFQTLRHCQTQQHQFL